jgi:hypothetical protein
MGDEMKMTIVIKNTEPVELMDLTLSLGSLADEYKKFLIKNESALDPDAVKLYIKEIRTGSIITDLVACAPIGLPFIEHAATIVKYAKYLNDIYGFLTGKSDKPKDVIEKTTYQNLSNIVEPIAKDKSSQFNIGAINVTGNITIDMHLNSLEANAAQNTARKEIEKLKEPDTKPHTQVLMYLYQARNDLSSTTGDKAIIESIHSGPVKTVFANEDVKSKVLSDKSNLFKRAFVVDAAVETISGIPKLYRISEIHEVFDLD